MNWREAGENSVCQVCPRNCEWQKHCSNPYRIEAYEEEEERTLDDLKMEFETVKSKKSAVKIKVDKRRQKVKDLFEKLFDAQQIIARLDEIAVKLNSLSELDYTDLLIESERQECKPGYMQ